MNKLLICALLCVSSFALQGQPFGNEWIEYDKRYYRIPIWEDGVYRISFQDLTAAGIPISLINPANIRLYAQAEEVPIYIHGVSDGVFNSGDYIEFIGKRNDGRTESVLYPSPEDQGNPHYSLFNDTARYFLTVTSDSPGLRYTEETDTDYQSYTPAGFVWFKSGIVYSNTYHHQPSLLGAAPLNDPNFRLSLSEFGVGEGWLSNVFGIPNTNGFTSSIPTPSVYRGAGAPGGSARSVVVGVSDMNVTGNDHFIQIRYGQNQTLAINFQYEGYKINPFEFNIPNASLGNETTPLVHKVENALGLVRDDQAVQEVSITYPRNLDLQGSSELRFLNRLNTLQSKTRYDFTNVSGGNPRIYTTGQTALRIGLTVQNDLQQALVPNVFGENEFTCYLVTDQSVKSIAGVEVAGNNGFFTNFAQSPVDSAFVIISHESLFAAAQQYSLYRQQKFNTVLVNVDELYDQFGYGVEKSGLAIRNFADFLLQNWTQSPQHLLLLGKSVRSATVGNLAGSRKSPANYALNLVPSLGYPPSDNYITAGLAGTFLEPAIRTGRVSAKNADEVFWYLDKLQSFESQPPAIWMKNVMHFGGGTTTQEQNRFANYLANYETAIEDSSFGGVVYTYLKTSSEPVQINVSQEISQLIEQEGVSLMTFFAHAGSEGFDQTIDSPSNFDWNGKYPFLLGNGCYSGDYHAPTASSTSEQYTILEEKGVIGFLASIDLGIEGDLNIFSREFYRQLSTENYGKSVGNHVRETIREVQVNSVLRKYLCYGMGLQGDPGVVINSWPKPDLAISEQDVFFSPAEITADIDSFEVKVVVSNIARATGQPFQVVLEHQTPLGIGDSTYVYQMDGLFYRDTAVFKLPVDIQFGLGLHSFDVLVDFPQDEIEELDGFEVVNNQVLGKNLFISSGGLVPIYPYVYSVIPEPNPVLVASTGNPLAQSATYRLEIDTTDTFNSPLLQFTEISQEGGLVEWQPNLNYPDSIVYYWRATELTDEEPIWRESSFQYIPEKSGWGQADFYQFKNNNFNLTEYNRDQRKIDFFTGTVSLRNNVIGGSASLANNIVLNTNEVEYGACFAIPSIHLAVFDPISFQAWGTNAQGQNPQNNFGNANAGSNCRERVEYYFIFRQNNPTQMQALADLLLSETIPDGHYVVLYTLNNVNYTHWDNAPEIYTAFESLGAGIIGSEAAADSVPFSLIVRKGDPEFVFEMYGNSRTDILNHEVAIPGSGLQGQLSTRRIGPAIQWKEVSWDTRTLDTQAGDESTIHVIGVAPNGAETVLPDLEFDGSDNTIDLTGLINAEQYPELRLQAFHRDEVNATPLQIDRWHVLYDKVPEAAVAPNASFAFKAENLQQGEEGYLSMAIANVSDVDMDSLLVHYWIEDANRNRIEIPYPRQDSLRAGEVLIDTVYFDTENLAGRNVFWVEVNPNSGNGLEYDQPEQTHFNNLVQIPFEVSTDVENPILDVTFDGVRIINGEIVSPNPEILIALNDENEFLLMDEPTDTALFKVFIAEPGGDLVRRFFSGPSGLEEMQFIPATDDKNRAKILFRPRFAADGDYRLLVQAGDKSGNQSGNIDYRIDFEVVNRSSISEVLNYPNPFSTSTQFVFTLTGSEIPDEFKIQIMTISGKVVREIMLHEFGPIRIGRNFSTYRWDGRDEYGDRLANGVYLYRVIARINGQDIDLRDNGASQHFTKGFGKMVLFR